MPNDLQLDAYFDVCTEFLNEHLKDAEDEDDKAKFLYAMFCVATQARIGRTADNGGSSKAERKASVSFAEKLMLEIVRGNANTARRYIEEENS